MGSAGIQRGLFSVSDIGGKVGETADPSTALRSGRNDTFILKALNAVEGALDVFERIAQGDGAAVGAAGGMFGFAQFGEQPVDRSGSSGMLILMAAWQAMEAAMRRRAVGVFALLAVGDGEDLFEHALEFAAFEADRGGLDRDGLRAEGLGFEAVAFELVGEPGEGDHLGGCEGRRAAA